MEKYDAKLDVAVRVAMAKSGGGDVSSSGKITMTNIKVSSSGAVRKVKG